LSKYTKYIFTVSLFLIAYGILCRKIGIYFFWESNIIGWIIFCIGLLSYFIDLHKTRKAQNKKTIWVKIAIGFLTFGLITVGTVIFIIRKSEAYLTAIEYIYTDPEITDEVGGVTGFGLIPMGSVQTTTINGVESGGATFELVVKGEKKYKEITISLKKTSAVDWSVISVY